MCPVTQADGHDAPRLIDEGVPGMAAVVEQVIIGYEDPVGEPVVAHELPEVFDRVQFGALGGSGMRVMLAGTVTGLVVMASATL